MARAELIIRTALLGDLPAIVRLDAALYREESQWQDAESDGRWSEGRGDSYFRARLPQAAYHCLLAEDGDQAAGYLFGCLKDFSDKKLGLFADIQTMYVKEAYRCQGLGTEMVCQFLAWVRERSAERVSVRVFMANERAISFYSGLGFKPWNLSSGDGFSCVHLHLDLKGELKEQLMMRSEE